MNDLDSDSETENDVANIDQRTEVLLSNLPYNLKKDNLRMALEKCLSTHIDPTSINMPELAGHKSSI